MRETGARSAFFHGGRGDWLADMVPDPAIDAAEVARIAREGLRSFITPEQRLVNIADALVDAIESGRHRGRAWEIKSSAEQLRDELVRYFAGKLPPVPDDGLPF